MLTQKQKEILKLIVTYTENNRIAPTARELTHLAGLKSVSTMHGYLERLKKKGYITWQDGMSRTIQILKNS